MGGCKSVEIAVPMNQRLRAGADRQGEVVPTIVAYFRN